MGICSSWGSNKQGGGGKEKKEKLHFADLLTWVLPAKNGKLDLPSRLL